MGARHERQLQRRRQPCAVAARHNEQRRRQGIADTGSDRRDRRAWPCAGGVREAVRRSEPAHRDRPDKRRGRGVAYALDLEHDIIGGREGRRGWSRDRRLRDVEGSRRRRDARASRMAADHREHAGLGRRRTTGRGPAARVPGNPWISDPAPWALHVGRDAQRGEATSRDSRIPVGSDGQKARQGMATVRIPAERRTITEQREVTSYLAGLGIDYERWAGDQRVAFDAPAEAVLAAYAPEIEKLKAGGGYVTADVIDVTSATPGLD